MHKPKIYTDKNAAISGMQKLETMCKNVEISNAQIQQKRRSMLGFVHMKEGTTAVTGSYKLQLLQSYRKQISPLYKCATKMDEEKEEREGK